ncbi:MAG: rhombosortase [Pseudomonadota bacterium]
MAQIRRPNGDSNSIQLDVNKRWILVFGVALVLLALGLGEEAARESLRYQRDSISNGQLWRFFTGHFVHLGWPHIWLNLTGWILISWVFGRDYRFGEWTFVYALGVLVLGAGFWWLNPQLEWYVGLSGLLHTGIVAGLFAWAFTGDRVAMLALAVVGAKLLWEQTAGPIPMTEEAAGGPVVVDAHLYGAIGGLIGAIAVFTRRKTV